VHHAVRVRVRERLRDVARERGRGRLAERVGPLERVHQLAFAVTWRQIVASS
jgi:hypothetical protein